MLNFAQRKTYRITVSPIWLPLGLKQKYGTPRLKGAYGIFTDSVHSICPVQCRRLPVGRGDCSFAAWFRLRRILSLSENLSLFARSSQYVCCPRLIDQPGFLFLKFLISKHIELCARHIRNIRSERHDSAFLVF